MVHLEKIMPNILTMFTIHDPGLRGTFYSPDASRRIVSKSSAESHFLWQRGRGRIGHQQFFLLNFYQV